MSYIIQESNSKVYYNSIESFGSCIIRDSNGNLHTTWASKDSPAPDTWKIFYAVSTDNGQTWTDGEGGSSGSAYEVIAGNASSRPMYPVISVDSNNYIYIVFNYETSYLQYELYLRRKTNLGWQAVDTSSLLVASHKTRYPRILIDSNDGIHIFAKNETDNDIYYAYSLDAGVNWTVDESFFSGTNYGDYIDFDIDLNNNIHLVYGYVSKLYYRKGTYESAGVYSWSAETEFTDGSIKGPVNILALDNDDIHLFWVRQTFEDGSGDGFLRRTVYSEGSWDSIASQFSIGSYVNRPQLGRDNNNHIHYFRFTYDGTQKNCYYSKWANTWSSEIQLNSAQGAYINCEKRIPASEYLGYIYLDVADDPNTLNFDTVEVAMNTVWENIDCDIRFIQQQLNDITNDIRVVSEHVSYRDVNCDIRALYGTIEDINLDIRCFNYKEALRDIDCDIRVIGSSLDDINCDIRFLEQELNDINCDIRVGSRNNYDIDCDIRCKINTLTLNDINCDIRVRATGDTGPTPSGLDEFKVYLNSVEISDVQIDSIQYEWTANETPATASFRVVRKSDNFNKTLSDIAQSITTNLPIEIRFNDNLRWYGYVMNIDVEQSGESVVVYCLDRKQKIQEQLYDISYGRKWEFPEQGILSVIEGDDLYTGDAIVRICDKLVEDGIINSYSGTFKGIITEYQETQGQPAGSLITEILNLSGNYTWNITPSGILEIYRNGNKNAQDLSIQEDSRHVNLYDIINYKLNLNDRSNLITTVEVTMGVEGEEERASYRITSGCSLTPDWDSSLNNYFNMYYGSSTQIDDWRRTGLIYIGQADASEIQEVGRKYRLSFWTEGSFIDNTFKPYVIGFNNYQISGWSWSGEYLTLATPLLEVSKLTKARDGSWVARYSFKYPVLVGRWYKKESVLITTQPTVFDVTWEGIAGEGAKRKINLTQLGIRDTVSWQSYEEGSIVPRTEPGYNDTEYARDRALLMLSRMNDPITKGNIDITFDAFEYYNLKLGNRINLTSTNEIDIYKNNNGFPLDIKSISFNVGSYTVSLECQHERDFIATKNYR